MKGAIGMPGLLLYQNLTWQAKAVDGLRQPPPFSPSFRHTIHVLNNLHTAAVLQHSSCLSRDFAYLEAGVPVLRKRGRRLHYETWVDSFAQSIERFLR